MMDIEKLLNEIESYKKLEDNWDSYGAKTPGEVTCRRAQGILLGINREFCVLISQKKVKIETCPSSKGISIQLTVLREE